MKMTLKTAVIWSPTYGIWYIITKRKLLYSNIYILGVSGERVDILG